MIGNSQTVIDRRTPPKRIIRLIEIFPEYDEKIINELGRQVPNERSIVLEDFAHKHVRVLVGRLGLKILGRKSWDVARRRQEHGANILLGVVPGECPIEWATVVAKFPGVNALLDFVQPLVANLTDLAAVADILSGKRVLPSLKCRHHAHDERRRQSCHPRHKPTKKANPSKSFGERRLMGVARALVWLQVRRQLLVEE